MPPRSLKSAYCLTLSFAAIAAGWGIATPARAQDGDAPAGAAAPSVDGGKQVYQAVYFTGFAPSTALDIVRRVPGFSLEDSDEEVRGFGGAAGNLVINGSRPSAKSDSLETILSRIPASRVLRVEVGPGDLFGAEFSGKPQVLNLVLSEGGGLAGNVTLDVAREWRGRWTPEASASALIRRGPSTFNASIGFDNDRTVEEGSDTLIALPSNNLIEFRRKVNTVRDRELYATGSWELVGDDTHGAHLNLRMQRDWYDLDQVNDVFPTGGTVRDDRLNESARSNTFELGGDVTRPLMGGGIKLVGLLTRRQRDNAELVLNRVQSVVIGGFAQTAAIDREESVLRAVWSNRDLGGWNIETGVEGALNQLSSDILLESIDAGGIRTRIDLPVDQAVVTEYRGEAFFNAGRALFANLRLDMGLTYEGSRLTVRGDTRADRSLHFFKPKASLDWRPGDDWRVQLSLARTVAQLDFGDFISVAELAAERVNGGNAELLPQRAWEARLTVERPILNDGLIKLESGYDRISLLQDRVPTPEGFDAPGNLGSGTMMFVRGTFEAPLGGLGIRGGRLTLNGLLRDTSVTDPYTLRPRHFSGYNHWDVNATFRQDLGQFAWGVAFYANPISTVYRRNEEDSFNGKEPYIEAFAEYRPTARTTVRLDFENLADQPAGRTRLFFTPDRSAPFPSALEVRERNRHIQVSIKLVHNFG